MTKIKKSSLLFTIKYLEKEANFLRAQIIAIQKQMEILECARFNNDEPAINIAKPKHTYRRRNFINRLNAEITTKKGK